MLEIGRWLIILMATLNGHLLIGQSAWGPPVGPTILSPEGYVNELNVVTYDDSAVGIYAVGDNMVYIFQLDNETAWYAPFWPAQNYQLVGLTLTNNNSTLILCGVSDTRHCWYGALDDNDPWFANWKYGLPESKVLLPLVIR